MAATDTRQGSDELSSYVLKEYDNYKINRQTLTEKWEKNFEAFRAIGDKHWKPSWKVGEGEDWRSDTFIMKTRQKAMSAYAVILDIMLRGGKFPFDLAESPYQKELSKAYGENYTESVKESIESMRRVIDEQILRRAVDRQLMKCMLSGSIFGETYMKYTVEDVVIPYWKQLQIDGVADISRIAQELIQYERESDEVPTPGGIYVSTFNVFRDLESDDMDTCHSWMHRVHTSPSWMYKKRNAPLFIKKNIKAVLDEQNNSPENDRSSKIADEESMPVGLRDITNRNNNLLYIERWGRVPRKIVDSFERDLLRENPKFPIDAPEERTEYDQGDEVEIMCCVCETRVVRYMRVPKNMKRPMMRAVWEESLDDKGGFGVADAVEDMQGVLNGAFRAYEDNTKMASSVLLAVKERLIDDMDNALEPGGKISINDEAKNVDEAFKAVTIPSIGASIHPFIELAEQKADDESLLPKIAQGIETDKAQTAYEFSQQIESAGKYIGSIIRNYDEGIIEPLISRMYDYNMDDPDLIVGKGSYVVKPLGYSSYEARVVKVGQIFRYLQLALSDDELRSHIEVRYFLETLAKYDDLDVDQALKSTDQMDAEAEAAAAQPDPLLEAELAEKQANTTKSQADAQKTRMEAEGKAIENEGSLKNLEDEYLSPTIGSSANQA